MRLLPISAVLLLAICATVEADTQTSLSFVSPSTIQIGGTVTVDFGVNFIPVPGEVGSTEFLDNTTANQVSSCASDANACTEVQILTTPSVLTSVFAELIVSNTPGAPNFYTESSAGTFQFVLPYPNPGTWEITTAGGGDEEQQSELECQTPFDMGVATGSASCSTIQTFSFTGTFDPAGTPDVFVTVNPAGTNTPEPASLALFGVGFTALGLWRRRVASAAV